MAGFVDPSDPHRRTKVAAAIVAAVTIVCLLALVIIVAREQVTGSVMALEEARDTGDPANTRAALENLAETDPHDADVQRELAAIARDEGRWLDAAAHWGRIARLDPLDPKARFEQARNLLAAGDAAATIAALLGEGAAPSPPEQVLLARAQLMRGELAAARATAERALASDPDAVPARLLAADLAFIDGDDDSAAAGYQRLLDAPQAAAAAQLGLAQVEIRRGDEALALHRLQAIDGPPTFQLLAARAGLYRQLGELALAEAQYRTLLDDRGPLPDVVVPLAELRAAAGDAAGIGALRAALSGTDTAALAARHYLHAIESYLNDRPEQAQDYLGWSANVFSGRDLYRWMQIDVGAQVGDVPLATLGVRALLDGVVDPQRRLRAAALLAGAANASVDGGDTAKAGAFATLALELAPELEAASLVQARVALLEGERVRARELAQGLADHPDYRAAALEVLGRAALADDDLNQAERWFDALAAELPEAATAPYWQGVTAFEAGELDRAAARLREALARRNDPRIQSALIDTLIAAADWDAAEAAARQVIASPAAVDRARGQAFLGGVLRARDDTSAAAAAYARAAELDPRRIPYALAAADLYMTLEDYDTAAELLDAAARRAPENRYVGFKRALLAQRAGDAQRAIERYRALLRETPDWALPMVNLSELLAQDAATRDEAVRLAERAAALTPAWVDAHWNLAQRKAEAGAEAQALAAAREVLALAPGHDGAGAMVAGSSP